MSDIQKASMTKSKLWSAQRLFLVLGSLGFLVGAGALGGAFSDRSGSMTPEVVRAIPVSILVAKAETGYVVERFFTGRVVARRSSDLGFERNGKIETILVDEGQKVAKGTVLARLDTSLLEVQLKVAAAQVLSAQALHQELLAGARPEVMEQARARVRERQAELEEIDLRRARVEELLGRKVAAQSEFDEVERQGIAARARLTSAEHALAELVAGTRKEKVAAQGAVVAQNEARVDELELEITKSSLLAPYAAVVSMRDLDEGAVVAGGTRVLRLVEDAAPEARIGVSLVVADTFTPGSKVIVRIGARREEAEVVALLPELDPKTRTRPLFIRLQGSFAPSQVVRLVAREKVDIPGFWLPISALTRAQRGLWSCYAVSEEGDKKTISRRAVEVIYTDGERAYVRGTLQDGDQIVRGGTDRVVAGQNVDVVKER